MEYQIADVLGLLAECVVLLQSVTARKLFGEQKKAAGDGATRPACSLRDWPNVRHEPPPSFGE